MTASDHSASIDLDALAGQVQALIDNADVEALLAMVASLHPADLAGVMERLDRFEQNFLFDALDPEVASQVLVELEHATREDVLEDLAEERIAPLVDELESDDAADVMGELDDAVRERVLRQVPEPSRAEVEQLLTYPEDTAGGIMALEVPWVRERSTVARAIEEVRAHRREIEEIHVIFVVDGDHRLVGFVTPLGLLLGDPTARIGDLMERDVKSVRPDMDQEEAAAIATRYDLISLAVVDPDTKLLGQITFDDVFDVIEEEEHEDISYMAGTGEDEPAERSAIKAVRERGPWLLLGIVGGLGSATVMFSFEQRLAARVELLFFVPVIASTAGNVAIQASSLVVRGLATGSFALQGVPLVLWRELRVSILLGAGLGLLLGGVAYVFEHDAQASVAMLMTLALVVNTAALGGTLIPLLLKRCGLDPAMAMGPFITSLNDVTGVTIYLLVVFLVMG